MISFSSTPYCCPFASASLRSRNPITVGAPSFEFPDCSTSSNLLYKYQKKIKIKNTLT